MKAPARGTARARRVPTPVDSVTREERLLGSRGLLVVLRPTDRKPLAFGRDPEAVHRLARRIQPATGEWKSVVERRGR